MKRFLPFCLLVLLSFTTHFAQAQCAISDVVVENERNVSSAGANACQTTVDISFTIENNNGNKHIFIHVWLQEDYPNYFQCVNGENTVTKPPVQADLEDAFATIALNNDRTTPTVADVYTPDETVDLNVVGSVEKVVLGDGSARITLRGVVLTLPVACGEPFAVVADVWSSQTPNAQVVQCASCSIDYSSLNITGLANCLTRQFTAVIESNSTELFRGNYRVYVDLNGNGMIDEGDARIVNTTQLTVPVTGTTTITGAIEAQYGGFDLILEIRRTSGRGTEIIEEIIPSTECAVLPVTFSSFTATRQNTNVLLHWETAMEELNKGFYVQRNTGDGWKDLSFVNSKATEGNSSSPLSYTYTDVNSFNGITQYRLQQVDIDGKSKFSEIRSVKGGLQGSRTIVYPNPSSNGAFNIAFDNVSTFKNVYLSDVSGRMLKQWKNVANNLQVADLKPGVYTLRIVDVQSGVQTTKKVIINKQ